MTIGKGVELTKPLKLDDFRSTISTFMNSDDAETLYKTLDDKSEGEGNLRSNLSDAARAY